MTLDFIPDANRWTIGFGWMGVDLFFVLSGYLISGQLLKSRASEEKVDYARFYRRRLLRTLPAYTVVVVIYFLLPTSRERPDIQPFWAFATFTENLLFDPATPKALSHAWSLCVEEQFYLVMPAVIAWLAVKGSSRRAYMAIAAVIFFSVWKYAASYGGRWLQIRLSLGLRSRTGALT